MGRREPMKAASAFGYLVFGSLAAVPQQAPGWSVTTIYYHDSVSAGGDVARARDVTIGNVPVNLTASFSGNVNANVNFGFLAGTYTFATPVFGAQASATLLAAYGSNSTSLAGTLRVLSRASTTSTARSWHLVT